MADDYLNYYRTLGIEPGTSWKQLRQTYKKLVNAWHPDRYQQNAHERKLAEEKTKEITRCYKVLAEYYRIHGALPLYAAETASSTGANQPTAEEPATNAAATGPGSKTSSRKVPKTARELPPRAFRVMTAMALAGFAYLLWKVAPDEPHGQFAVSENTGKEKQEAQRQRQASSSAPGHEAYFSVGSSLGEVYAIQGIPTSTEGDAWRYGNSTVYFSEGKVVRWEENIDNPLKVHGMPEADTRPRLYFGIGSSREDVLAAQGRPDRDMGNIWEYGFSRVYFKNDRVIAWREEPPLSLRVRR